jgi:Asp/Glu/hydantoin racemase
MAPLRIPGGPEIRCVTLAEGPPAVESQSDADRVILPLCRLIREAEAHTAAFVIACFSDPGLFSARETTAKPVLGIAECGILTAVTLGHRFGVISILARSVPRHLRYIAAMGVGQRLAADLPVGLRVLELADARMTLARMIERPPTARPARCRRARHGLQRHGALPRRTRRGGPDPGRRTDPSRRHDGNRARPPRLGPG